MNEPLNKAAVIARLSAKFPEGKTIAREDIPKLIDISFEYGKKYMEYERTVNEAKLHRDLGGINATMRSVGIKTKDSSFMSVPPGFEDLKP